MQHIPEPVFDPILSTWIHCQREEIQIQENGNFFQGTVTSIHSYHIL